MEGWLTNALASQFAVIENASVNSSRKKLQGVYASVSQAVPHLSSQK